MARRHVLCEREFVEQHPLHNLPIAHHRLHSRFDSWSESARQRRRNLGVFQRNRSKAAVLSVRLHFRSCALNGTHAAGLRGAKGRPVGSDQIRSASAQNHSAVCRDHSGSPALRRPSSYLATSSGRRYGPSTSLRLETRSAGLSCRNRATALCAGSSRPASALLAAMMRNPG